jgi:DNA-directed RNA polymerase-3 subunit RPC5
MTVKSSIDGEEDSSDNMAERIMVAQQEPWQHHRYIDEDSVDAWATFHENLFVGNEYEDKQELVEKVPKLSSVFQDSELLDKVSVTRDAAKLSRDKRGGTKGTEDEDQSDTSMTSDSPSDSDSE